MLSFLLRRTLLALPALFGVALVVFILMRTIPGDVVTGLVGLEGNLSPERQNELRRLFGLDLPIYEQFRLWFGAALQGDLGSSLRTGRPVVQDLLLRLPVTLELTLLSLAVALLIAFPAGILAARWRGTVVDYGLSAFGLLGLSVPSFFLGILMILLFSLKLRWLPPAGLAERNPSRWRRSSGSAPMRERTSWADTVSRAARSFSVSAAAMSRYTPQWMSGSFS